MTSQVDLQRCAHCGAWIPAAATMCASCGTSDVDGQRARSAGGAPAPRRPAATRALAGWTVTRALLWVNALYLLWALRVQFAYTPGVNVLAALVSLDGLNHGNYLAGGYRHGEVVAGEWWRAVTAFFLHGGLLHIGMNMWVLSRLGPLLEDLIGAARFLVVYLVSGIGSTLAISIWYAVILRSGSTPMMIGASGAIFGVLGALATYALRAGSGRGRALGMMLWRDILMMLLLGAFIPVVSNTGHVGGLIPGVIFGLAMGERFTDATRPSGRHRWLAAAGFLSALTLLALAHGVDHSLRSLGGRW